MVLAYSIASHRIFYNKFVAFLHSLQSRTLDTRSIPTYSSLQLFKVSARAEIASLLVEQLWDCSSQRKFRFRSSFDSFIVLTLRVSGSCWLESSSLSSSLSPNLIKPILNTSTKQEDFTANVGVHLLSSPIFSSPPTTDRSTRSQVMHQSER